ncbi:MAG: hypothetical protein NTV52_22365, partial [Acidobacteria bacterium]|nr:hypothetical protein [Acidobacteriota bacterium]
NARVVGTGGSPAGSVTAPVIVTVRVPVAPFTMTAPGALQVTPGGNGTVVVTIVRSAGFTGPVTVVAEGLSAGLTVSPVTIASGATTGNVVFVATAGATGGTSAVRLVGTGGTPLAAAAATVNVTVAQTLTLAIDAARTEIKAGTVGSIPVRLTSNGAISGRIEFSVGGLPAGATLGLVAGTVPNSYVIKVTVPTSAAAGTSTLQIGAKVGAMVAAGQTTTLVIVK